MNAWKPTDEQIEELAKQWINDWDTRADEHEDWIADFHNLIASDAGQSILRAAQAEAFRAYAVERFERYLERPEIPWVDQPEGAARNYAKVAADLRAEADRIEAQS